ncbi:MAG: ATP-binding protein, partial [Candidatus Omnitrophica bacterium]|nr:ATP-binding protein [Candidatus Omnitrophota bacterium]
MGAVIEVYQDDEAGVGMKTFVMQYFRNFRITTKFILWFLFISLAPLAIAIYVSYSSSQKVVEEEVKNSLFAVTDNKANQIEAYLQKSKEDAVALSSMPEVIDAMEKFTNVFRSGGRESLEYSAVEQEFSPMWTYYQKSFGYDDIIFVSLDGDPVFSIQRKKELKSLYEIALYKKSELSDVFIRANISREVEISNFEYYPQVQGAAVFIAVPVFKSTNLIGVMVVQMSNKGIYKFAQDYSGLGNTGETIVVSKIKEEAVFITPLRFDAQAAFKREIKIGSSEEREIQKALQGGKGSGIFTDYRGQQVLAVWRYLPTFRLGMVVKIDTQEVFASAKKLRNNLLKISFTLLIVVVIAAFFIARSVSRPITELTHISKIISEGKLSARAEINTKDEIGELAASFNQMTNKLVEAKVNVEQKKAEVEEQKRLLEEANKELDSFVYTVSHDLRAPLRGIDGLANILEQDYAQKLDNQGKDYLSKIRKGAIRMKQLIDDLLTLSRISRIKNPYEDVNMNELVTSVINRIEFDIKEYKVELKIASNLPVVHCDRIKMEEVLLNLISNAIKFSSKNKNINPRVEVGYNDRGEAHEFYVKDNGIGIDKKYHDEIFGIFKRLHTQEEYEGTGAGLSIVKRIIDDHKGNIWIDSEPSKGAAFFFTITKAPPEK